MGLIEVLVALAVSTLIMVPLASIVLQMFTASTQAQDRLKDSNDGDSVGRAWTRDVQSVDPGRLNVSWCRDYPDVGSIDLVSFSWREGEADALHTASWYAVGSGADTRIVRRECNGETVVAEAELTDNLGLDGTAVSTLVHGPAGAGSLDFCPATTTTVGGVTVTRSSSCTIVLDGAFKYTLTVTRRAEDRTGQSGVGAPPPPVIDGADARNEYIVVSWTQPPPAPVPPIDEYKVTVHTQPYGPAVQNVTLDGLSNAAEIPGVDNGTNYWIRIQSCRTGVCGEYTPPFGPVTPVITGPDKPTVVGVTPGDQSATVSWTPNDNNGGSPVTGWQITATDGSNTIGPVTVAGTATSGTIGGLTNGISYTVSVTGVNAAGPGISSDPSQPVVPYGLAPPPASVTAKAGDALIAVQWTPAADGNGRTVMGYTLRFYQGLGATSPMGSLDVDVTTAGASCTPSLCTYTRTGVPNAAYYQATVATRTQVDASNVATGAESSRSAPFASPYTPGNPPYVRPSTAPAAPTAPTLSWPGASTLRVTVTPPSNTGGEPVSKVNIVIDRKAVTSSTWENNYSTTNAAVSGTGVQTYDLAVTAGYVYQARVQAGNRGEWFVAADPTRYGAWSSTSGTVTVPTVPSKPNTPTVAAGDRSVTVNWAAPASDGGSAVTGYTVVAKAGSTVVSTTDVGVVSSYTVTGLTAGTSYTFTVAAKNVVGTGAASDPSAVVIPWARPATPGSVLAKAGDAQITVQWTPPTDTGGRSIIGYTLRFYQGVGATSPLGSLDQYVTVSGASCAATCTYTRTGVPNGAYYQATVATRTDLLPGTSDSAESVKSNPFASPYAPGLSPYVRPSTSPSTPAAPTVSAPGGAVIRVVAAVPADGGQPVTEMNVQLDRQKTGSSTWESNVSTVNRTVSGTGNQTYDISGLASGYNYRARVQAGNRGEWFLVGDATRFSAYSANSGTALIAAAPQAPRNVVLARPAGSFGTELRLDFDPPTDDGGSAITGYSITCTAPSGTTATASASPAAHVTTTISGSNVRDGRTYTCSVTATNALGTGPAAASNTAMPYGECTLRSSLTVHIKENEGAQNRFDTFYTFYRTRNFIWESWSKREAGLIAFNFANACEGKPAMAGSAYVASATFGAYVEGSGSNLNNQLHRITSAWSSSTAWAGPSYGAALNTWNADSVGWRNTTVTADVQQMKAGTNNYGFAIRNNEGSCGTAFCEKDSARYSGYTNASTFPRLTMTFYTQGA